MEKEDLCESVPGSRGERRMTEGVSAIGMYCKNFGKCHSVPPQHNINKKKKNLKKKQNLRNLKYVFPTLFSWEINFIFAGVARATLPQVSSSVLTCTPYLI
jgi:hypothetical protein